MGLNAMQTDEPYIRITRQDDRYTVEGLSHCYLSPIRNGESSGAQEPIYAEWSWDGTTLTVRNDRLGFYPLFYAHSGQEFLVSPSLSALLARGASRELDEAALATFLRLGFFLGEDTPFKAIRALPPNGCLRWTVGAPQIQGSLWCPKPQSLKATAAMDLYADVLRAAVRQRIPADRPWALLLSGGQDSRHILLTLWELGRLPDACLTARYYSGANEDIVAASVARAFGAKHVILDQDHSELAVEARKNVLTHYGAFEHDWAVVLMDHVAGRYGALYDGIGGDVLSAGLYQDEYRLRLFQGGRLRELADVLMGSEGYWPGLLTTGAYRRLGREVARERIAAELSRHHDAANPLGSFFFWNRTRRGVALNPFALLGRSCSVLTPYLDPGVYELLASLPATMFLDHQFHLKTIARAFPQAAEIPYQPKQLQPNGNGAAYRRLALDLLRHSRNGSGLLARRSFISVRALRALVDTGYAPAVRGLSRMATYLFQLEAMTSQNGVNHGDARKYWGVGFYLLTSVPV